MPLKQQEAVAVLVEVMAVITLQAVVMLVRSHLPADWKEYTLKPVLPSPMKEAE